TAEGDGLAVPDAHIGCDTTGAEDGLIDGVIGQRNAARARLARDGIELHTEDRAAVVDKAVEIDDFRIQLQINGITVGADNGCDVEGDTDVPRFKRAWNGRCDHNGLRWNASS